MSLLLQGVLFIVVILSAIFATGGSVTSPSPSISSEVPQNIRNTSSLVSAIKAHIISAPGPVTHPKGFASYPLLVSPTASPIHASNENGRPGLMSPSVEHQTAVSSPPSLHSPNGQLGITRIAPSTIHSPPNISSHRPARAPSFSSSPLNHELNNGVPVAAHLNWISNNRHPVSSSYTKGSSPVMSPQPHEVVEPPNVTVAPLSSQSHHSSSNPVVSPISHDMKPPTDARAPLGSSPVVNPMPHEGKARLNVTLSPLPSNLHPSETSPMLSPVPNELNDPSNINHVASHPQPSGSPPAISPTLHGMEEPSHSSHSHLPSHPSPLESSSPIKSPTPHELEPSNFSHAPLYSHSSSEISPTPHEVKEPSNVTDSPLHLFSPIISPTPHEVMNPSNITHAPLSSNPKPLGSSPAISPASQELKDPSKTTNAPLASHPEPSRVTPPISPRPQEVNKPSNATPPLPSHPLPSESSPVMSPVRSETNNPSNITRDHLASNPKPSKSSPARSPTPHEAKEPSYTTQSPLSSHKLKGPLNITNSPLASHLKPSGSSLTISPTPQEVNETSNASHSPLPSHLLSSPLISPTPHEVKEPSNITHSPLSSHELKGPSNITNAPVASHRKPSGSSPMISPTPQEVNETSNAAPPPLPLLSFPSPLISPTPHEVKDPSNITHTPSTSPTISPTPHELKEPSNATHSPLPSHPFPLQSSPAMSPEPHEVKEPSNVTHSLSPLHPHLSNYSHALSPLSHAVTDSLNKTHAPLASSLPVLSPKPLELHNSSHITHAPLASHAPPPPLESALAPLTSSHQRNSRIKTGSPSFSPLSSLRPPSHHPGPVVSAVPQISPVSQNNRRRDHAPPPYSQGTSFSPAEAPSQPPVVVPKNNQRRHHAPTPNIQVPSHSPIQSPFPSKSHVAHPPSQRPIYSPILPPSGASALRKPRAPPPLSVWALPPPPPNTDCKSLTCFEPNTYPPPGSLCACVLPIKVRLRLYIALYTFFPLVSELAHEIASGIFVNQSQVRIMGANADLEDPEKTIVIIDLVPLGGYFHMNSALLIFQKFWHKQVAIEAMYFVDYDVLAVLYPGLPPSPPTAPGDGSVDGSTFDNGENARSIKPLGVDVGRRKGKVRGSLIAIIVLSSVSVLVSAGVAWLLLLKCRDRARQPPAATPQQALHPFVKSSVAATGPPPLGSGLSSTTTSFSSSIAGSAKTFSLPEIERATNRFHESRIIGEGGFGRVYLGTLEGGTMVAVKVLKRDDQQGGREFLAEVEMLSRLHHRNLVKLIGICTEESARCLVYELIPNGSVESHLHGIDKETSPLDWNARMKIALGAARGLAYLHEDSSPRVIHRDFKSSNILLEHDFTPKVSDFGLARTALDEGNDHISTRVMGTFGYVAPEYAMTGHLLVKSDVYSYGVVLLELLTGRKPVDMSQPPGQENLVNWARPLLTSMEGLSTMIDPALGMNISFDSVAKVAAIASMCTQPEVSHRPFMGEVVQALKLVCNESDEYRRSFSQDDSSTKDSDIRISTGSGQEERVVSETDMFCTSAAFSKDASGSFRRYSSSGPLRDENSQKFWQRERGFLSGSLVETGAESFA